MLSYRIIKRKFQKRICFTKILSRSLFFFLLNIIRNKTILIGTPNYTNIGDTAIAEASRIWINDNYKGYAYLQLQEVEYLKVKFLLKLFIRKNDILFLQGGGNMGDRYPQLESHRRDVVTSFINNRIVIMPVTIYFSESLEGKHELERSVKTYNSHPKLTLLCRDEVSYNFSNEYFNQCKSFCVPDIVCTMKIPKTYSKKNTDKILLCKRNDVELLCDIDIFISKVDSLGIDYLFQDTELSNKKNELVYKTAFKNYNEQVDDLYTVLNCFNNHKLIITDRYHGLVFSYITKTPCIVLDSADHKIKEGIKWFEDCNYIFYIGDDLSLLAPKISEALRLTDFYSSKLVEEAYQRLPKRLLN